jgi:hypothetical protein
MVGRKDYTRKTRLYKVGEEVGRLLFDPAVLLKVELLVYSFERAAGRDVSERKSACQILCEAGGR